ncbi:ATP-binding protein [Lentzea sp. PSKA42]|uniref:ATP-binding protein n=1 Tax=Lentzea indica TaxID=2604800 RepID=A0ABX1FDI3_9PSEU|nr:ATP-binding protein [Lentzea indica]NKE56912.1 ATP-binding protein [Lentzea indica]
MTRRIGEQELVTELVRSLRRGGGAVFEVTGPPGSGRTAMLWRIADHVTGQGARLIAARASAVESNLDGAVLTRILADLGADPDRSMTALCRVFLEAGPLVLVLDDAQWMDESSVIWLRALLRRIHRAPVVVVLATAGLGTAAEDMLAELAEDGSVTAPPWYVVRLPEPTVDEDRIARTLHVMSEWDIRLLRAMAVCGGRFEWSLVRELADLDRVLADRAMTRLRGLGLVATDEPRLTDGVARAVLAAMSGEQRNDLRSKAVVLGHQAALGFEQMSALLVDAPPVGTAWARQVLQREARVLATTGRTADAARLLIRALSEPADEATRADILIQLAQCELDHAPEASDRRLVQVLHMTEPAMSDPRLRAADMLACREHFGVSRRAIETAIAHPSLAESEQEALRGLYWYVVSVAGEPDELGVPAVPSLPDSPADPVCQGIAAWHLARGGSGGAAAVALATRALAVRGPGPLTPRIAAADVLSWAAEYETALAGIDAVLVDGRRYGARVAVVEAMLLRCSVRLRQGRVVEAAEDLAGMEAELPRSCWHPLLSARHLVLEVVLLLAAGLTDEARQALVREATTDVAHGLAHAWRLFAHGLVALVTEPATAARTFVECGRGMRDMGVVNPAVLPWRLLGAMGWRAAGEVAHADALIAEAHDLAVRWGVPGVLRETREFADVVHGMPAGDAARAFAAQSFPGFLARHPVSGCWN